MVRISGTQKMVGIIVAIVALGIGGALFVSFFPTASNQGYMPEQPIPFSHKLHAGVNKIDCKYCHQNVEYSRHATIPPVSTCMGCHRVIKTDSPHIQKIHKAFNEGKPIEWIRVHELPDYVYFPHHRHIAAGAACENCHGDVKKMDRIEQHSALTMGWCMECHRGETTPANILKHVYPKEKHPKGPVAPVNCTTCHN